MYAGKHTRGQWGEFVGRVRDLHAQVSDLPDLYEGRHRDNSDQGLVLDLQRGRYLGVRVTP